MAEEKTLYANLLNKWVQPAPRMEEFWPELFRPASNGGHYAQIVAVWISPTTPWLREDDDTARTGEDVGTVAALITDVAGQLAVVPLVVCSLAHPIEIPAGLLKASAAESQAVVV